MVTSMDIRREDGLPIRAQEIGSGVLVAPCLVLTARHVLGEAAPSTGAQRIIEVVALPTSSTPSAGDSVPLSATIAVMGGGRAGWRRRGLLDDWALLRIKRTPTWMQPVPLDETDCCRPDGRTRAALVGFAVDHFDPAAPVAWADPDCAVVERLANRIVATNCLATSGNSGGPVLLKRTAGWRVGAVLTRAQAPDAGGRVQAGMNFAIPIDSYLRRMVSEAQREGCESA